MSRPREVKNNTLATSKNKYMTLGEASGMFRARLSNKISNKATYFYLGIKATHENLGEAINLINKIEETIINDINSNNFDNSLEKYKPQNITFKSSIKTFNYYLDNFEKHYFITRKVTSKSKQTFKNTHFYFKLFFKSYLNEIVTIDILRSEIEKYAHGSAKRVNIIKVSKVLFKSFEELKRLLTDNYFDFGNYSGGYKGEVRYIPTDDEILYGWYQIGLSDINYGQEKSWQWVYMMLATYGLRSHELLAIDYSKSFNTEYNEIVLDETLCDGIKTGDRTIFPLDPKWVNAFQLNYVKKPEYTKILTSVLEGKAVRGSNPLYQTICYRFRFRKLKFKPYDLRHAYAIRGFKFGIPITAMSKYMGHTIKTHESKYQKYMSTEVKAEAYKNAIFRYNSIQKSLKGELTYEQLQNKCNLLEAENKQLQVKLNNLIIKQ